MYILVWRAGSHGESRATLAEGQTLTIGRGDTCDITLDDEAASRQHTRVRIDGGKVVIQDLASRNGTWLAGKRTTTATWKPGRPLRIGDTDDHVASRRRPIETADRGYEQRRAAHRLLPAHHQPAISLCGTGAVATASAARYS